MSGYLLAARACVSALPFFALAACGGGGGINSTPTPSSAGTSAATTNANTSTVPTITSTTALSPSTANTNNINYDDAEFQLSNVTVKANALTAYNNGATGNGIKIAILDSGLSDATGQFAGRIDAASRDMVSNRGIGDEVGHGTSVAAIAAAGRNGSDIMGVAFDASLLVARTDNVGSCTSASGCAHSDDTLAKAVDYARSNGAKVINMSLGGSTPNATLVKAVKDAATAGIVVVISAGNEASSNPDAFAQMAAQPGMDGMVIIAGSHDASYAISSFSDRAGTFGQYYLTAMGEAVRAFNQTGTDFLYSGTSYSAPAIAGAVALLEQAFPNLTPKQIVDLLYSTATDAGAPGTDAIYGRGILNLAKAFQPQGSASLAGSATAVSLESNAVLSPAMGDAVGQTGASLSQTVIVDSLGRAFHVNLGGTISHQNAPYSLAGNLIGNIRTTNLGNGPVAFSLNSIQNRATDTPVDLVRLGLSEKDARIAHVLSGRMMARFGKSSQAVFGFQEGTDRLAAMLEERGDLPFIVARESGSTFGFGQSQSRSAAFRHESGKIGLSIAGESGVIAGARGNTRDSSTYQSISLRMDRHVNSISLSFAAGIMREKNTVLGSQFSAALGGGGALTKTADIRASWNIGSGWALIGAMRQAWTTVDARGPRVRGGLTSNAFSIDISHVGQNSHAGLRVAQPMRVETGHYVLNLPTDYDYASGAANYAHQSLGLAPKGREITAETTYGRRLAGGWIDANLYLRSQPGNVANASKEMGAAIRFSSEF